MRGVKHDKSEAEACKQFNFFIFCCFICPALLLGETERKEKGLQFIDLSLQLLSCLSCYVRLLGTPSSAMTQSRAHNTWNVPVLNSGDHESPTALVPKAGDREQHIHFPAWFCFSQFAAFVGHQVVGYSKANTSVWRRFSVPGAEVSRRRSATAN